MNLIKFMTPLLNVDSSMIPLPPPPNTHTNLYFFKAYLGNVHKYICQQLEKWKGIQKFKKIVPQKKDHNKICYLVLRGLKIIIQFLRFEHTNKSAH